MQLCLGAADGHLQLRGDLLVFPALDVMQHQYRARPRRQRRQRALQVALGTGAAVVYGQFLQSSVHIIKTVVVLPGGGVRRYSPKTLPDDPAIIEEIEAHLPR